MHQVNDRGATVLASSQVSLFVHVLRSVSACNLIIGHLGQQQLFHMFDIASVID